MPTEKRLNDIKKRVEFLEKKLTIESDMEKLNIYYSELHYLKAEYIHLTTYSKGL